MLLRPLVFSPGEAAPTRVLPALTNSTAPVRQEPERRAPLLPLRHPQRRATIADKHPDYALLRPRAKAEQSALRWFALELYALLSAQGEVDLCWPRDFSARFW